MNNPAANTHWLVRRKTLRRLSGISLSVLAISVLAQWWFPYPDYFGIDGWPGFAAVFGFASCVVMVLAAKLMGLVLKRPDDYYDGDGDD